MKSIEQHFSDGWHTVVFGLRRKWARQKVKNMRRCGMYVRMVGTR